MKVIVNRRWVVMHQVFREGWIEVHVVGEYVSSVVESGTLVVQHLVVGDVVRILFGAIREEHRIRVSVDVAGFGDYAVHLKNFSDDDYKIEANSHFR